MIPTIGIRSDLLPSHPVPKMDLDMNHLGSLQGLPALEALRRQAGNTNSFLSNLPGSPIMPNFSQGRPSQPPTPQSTGSQDLGSGSWTFEEQFKQVLATHFTLFLSLSYTFSDSKNDTLAFNCEQAVLRHSFARSEEL